jgi:hypothetical protein
MACCATRKGVRGFVSWEFFLTEGSGGVNSGGLRLQPLRTAVTSGNDQRDAPVAEAPACRLFASTSNGILS